MSYFRLRTSDFVLQTCLGLVLCAGSAFAAGRPITATDLLALQRISDPRISPDGTRVLYTVAVPDLPANRTARNVWVVSLASPQPRALTTGGHEGAARWSPDGRSIAFLSNRSGSMQLYVMNADGTGDPRQLTKLSADVDNVEWAPDGRSIAFTSEVFPDCKDDACNAARDQARAKSAVHARVYDRLLYRHWTSWSEGKRGHLFVVPAGGGEPRDLLPGADYDVPPREREGPHPIAFAPDSRTIAFTAVTDPMEALSTNGDIFEVDVAGATGAPKRLTTNPGFDGAPAYSPDGKTIAYRSQARAGHESDQWRLMVLDRTSGRSTSLTDAFDRSVDSPAWSTDGRTIFFNAEDHGEMPVFAIPREGGVPRAVTPGAFDGEFQVGAGTTLVVARSSLAAPAELFAVGPPAATGAARPLTHHNQPLLAPLDLAKPEAFTFRGAGGTQVQGFLVRPPAFDAAKEYPMLLLIHGGPQGMWGDTWSYRWNAQLFSSPGYVSVMINPRGSTGFGQAFTDEISGDWGGKPLEDLMSGLDFVLRTFAFTDRERVAAAGGSYGGYMVDWLASQSKGRFRALVSHAGVYDLTSMYATEELWFVEHEFGGPPWANAETYRQLSPHTYAGEFGKYKTPTLVIAGEQDFRVPYTQSLELFNALQRQGVPSKLVLFPDEGHWVLKPQNSAFWYAQVLDWFARFLARDAPSLRKSVR
jgi:dipeptidyl aminopeptidase/acylaminoacyl peptidase